MNRQVDALAAQLHDWTEAALALDEAHFPREMLNELDDLVTELKALIDEDPAGPDQNGITEQFINPEMAEVVGRFPRVRRLLERALGSEFLEQLSEESGELGALDDDED